MCEDYPSKYTKDIDILYFITFNKGSTPKLFRNFQEYL